MHNFILIQYLPFIYHFHKMYSISTHSKNADSIENKSDRQGHKQHLLTGVAAWQTTPFPS